jgi:transposase
LNSLASARIKRYEKVNSEKIQAFFTELRTENGSNKRIHLILDGAGYHRAKVVKDKADELNITLHFLPPNSPNLNPIERLWKVMGEHVRKNKYFATVKALRDKIDEFFSQTLPKIRDILASRIKDNFQVLNSAS